jgi:putative methyltransferase
MSLYHEASQVLENIRKNGGSIKSVVLKKTWKSDSKALFALATKASKWSEILKEVLENSGVLKAEKQVSLDQINRFKSGLKLCSHPSLHSA